MRKIVASMLLLVVVSSCWAADETVEQLKARVETSRPEDRVGLCLQIAQQQLRNTDKFFTDGNVEQAHAALQEILTYSDKARDGALQSKKHQKNVEITVRKISDRLRDIKRTLAFEDQPAVQKAIEHLEEIRTVMLAEMFGKDKSKEKK